MVKVPPRQKNPEKLTKVKTLKKSEENAKGASSRNSGANKTLRTHVNKDEEKKEEKSTNALTRRRSQADVRLIYIKDLFIQTSGKKANGEESTNEAAVEASMNRCV